MVTLGRKPPYPRVPLESLSRKRREGVLRGPLGAMVFIYKGETVLYEPRFQPPNVGSSRAYGIYWLKPPLRRLFGLDALLSKNPLSIGTLLLGLVVIGVILVLLTSITGGDAAPVIIPPTPGGPVTPG